MFGGRTILSCFAAAEAVGGGLGLLETAVGEDDFSVLDVYLVTYEYRKRKRITSGIAGLIRGGMLRVEQTHRYSNLEYS